MARVDGNGLVTAISLGVATVTATLTNNAFVSDSARVEVSAATPPPSSVLAGTYPSTTAVRSDPGDHAGSVRLSSGLALILRFNNITVLEVSGPNGSNWVTVNGPRDAATGAFSMTGRGSVAGRTANVRFTGRLEENGRLSGDYAMGVDGELPGGQAITYRVEGRRAN